MDGTTLVLESFGARVALGVGLSNLSLVRVSSSLKNIRGFTRLLISKPRGVIQWPLIRVLSSNKNTRGFT